MLPNNRINTISKKIESMPINLIYAKSILISQKCIISSPAPSSIIFGYIKTNKRVNSVPPLVIMFSYFPIYA